MALTETTETQKTETTLIPTQQERAFALAQREATALANSALVPKEFNGNVANCLIALNLARRIGADPLMVMQNLDVIHGRPSFRATFLIACLNQCGRFTPLRYRFEGEGDARTCIAVANDKDTGEEYEGPPVSIEMAKAEGWATKNGSKWKTMPDLMLRYRAAAFFARTTAPEVAMGLYTAEEIHDMQPEPASRGASAVGAADAIARARDVTPPKDEAEESADEDCGESELDDNDRAFFGLDGEADA
ncbi:MAG: recombinase RecT [Dehalococcoidia bacterium]|nr:recombinase RecT [Myxococcales bacterium]MCA9857644.1 recombinase RecT [Dehalococcoidia bacterium]